ncbi:hypothetical protein PR048_020338 [Dryococelus australis]|uniref:CCHC-type domain-containing protein n=1 Tax=Dryococelus australis TaxID=614101 RepID=A0ABQ9H656_9NEOP|nr:hypothetical protein PR048_020338 [Dryococelus australis]
METVEGKIIPLTEESDKSSAQATKKHEEKMLLEKTEFIAQHISVCSLSTQVCQLVNMCTSTKEMWDKLHSVYKQRTEQRQDLLFNEFFNIREKDLRESVAKHIAKLEKLWVELQDETWNEDKAKLPDSLFLNRVLNTMPLEYFEFMNTWESVPKEQRNLIPLRERLCVVEMRLQERINNEVSALTAKMNQKLYASKKTVNTKGPKCFNCGKVGHIKKYCPEDSSRDKTKAFSSGAGNRNHRSKNKDAKYIQ